MTISVPSLTSRCPSGSSTSLQSCLTRSPASVLVHSDACTASTVEQLLELCHSAISVFTLLSDKFVKLVLQTTFPCCPRHHEAAGIPLVRGQGQLRRGSLRQRLIVDHNELALVASSRSSGPLSEAALLLEVCSLLQPAQFFVRKRSRSRRCWSHECWRLRRGDCAACHVAADHPARGREGAVQALAVQGPRRPPRCGARERPGGCEAAAVAAPKAVSAREHVEVPGVGRVVDGQRAACDSGG